MASRSFGQSVKASAIVWTTAAGLLFAPKPVTEPIRMAIYDAVQPGQVALLTLRDWGQGRLARLVRDSDQAPQLEKLRSQLEASKLRNRQYELNNVALRQQLAAIKKLGTSPYTPTASEPLIVPVLINARVLGRETADRWRAGKIIDRGKTAGVQESSLVLDSAGMLIDQGGDIELTTEQPVFAGRCVVGKIEQVGRWSSTVQLVTDPGFRTLAKLARKTPQGLMFTAEGQLEGQGTDLCRLRLISSTEPVQVGYEVYTAIHDGRLPLTMYLGRVVKAQLEPNTIHWDIWVKPATAGLELKTVQVLRESLNPLRMLGQ